MKRIILLAACMALALATVGRAEEAQEGVIVLNPAQGGIVVAGEGQPLGVWGGGNEATMYIQNMDKAVGLTEEQKKSITGIFDERKKAMDDFSTQNADKLKKASKAITDAYKSQDQDAIAGAMEDYQKLYEPMHKIMKKSTEDLAKVLTAEQTVKLQDSKAMAYIKMMTAPAKLSDDQVKQMKAAYKDAMKGEREGAANLGQSMAQILTPDQKTTIVKTRATSYVKSAFAAAKLTADQQKQADAIVEEAAKDADLQNFQLYGDLNEKISALLTDDQKQAMKSGGGWAGGGMAPRRNPGGNPGATKR